MLKMDVTSEEFQLVQDYRKFELMHELVTNPVYMAKVGKTNVNVLLYRCGLTPLLVWYEQETPRPNGTALIRAFWIQDGQEVTYEESAVVQYLRETKP